MDEARQGGPDETHHAPRPEQAEPAAAVPFARPADAATLILDCDLHLERYSPTAAELFDLSTHDVGRPFAEILRRTGRDALLPEILSTAEPARRALRFESEGRWYRVVFVPRHGADDEGIRGIVASFVDVTQQQRVEQALAVEHDAAHAYLNVAGVIVVVLDRTGRIVFVNRKGCELLGCEREEKVLGAPWIETFVPERARAETRGVLGALWEGNVETGGTNENWIVKADGEERLVEWSNAVLRDPAGAVRAVVGTGIDVTERRRLEAEVLRVTDEERHRIGRDLHDGLGSHLTGLGMLARSLARTVRRGQPVTPDELDELAELIGSGAEQARVLARGLDPADVRGEGLPRALAHLAADTSSLTTLDCTFRGAADLPALPPATATQLYWIAQEAVTNALKHADATHLQIALDVETEAAQPVPHTLVLSIRDDGRGLGETHVEQASANGMGLRTMRYRARLIGAALAVTSGEGVTVTCRLPLPATP